MWATSATSTGSSGSGRCSSCRILPNHERNLPITASWACGEHGAEQRVETAGNLPVEPAFGASGALVHRDVEYERDVAVALGKLGCRDGLSLAPIAPFTSHRRLLL